MHPSAFAQTQNLPVEFHFSTDGHRLITGNQVSTGLYDESLIRTIDLQFPQSNYWTLLTNNYQSKTEIPAAMTVEGQTYDSVGVRFKGSTSYNQYQGQKKSFAIATNFTNGGQDIMGYNTLNLNNCFLDPSFLREVMYLNLSRKHIPSAKGNFVHLTLNGQDWGLYANIQNLDNDYLKEWFLSDNGTRWRCERTSGGGGGGGGGGGNFGAGKSSLNWLGADTSLYKPNYTLKKTHKTNPWDDLVKTCNVLNNTPATLLEDSLKNYLDIDQTLWFLATEILFTDDDSYVWKGGMDYFLYWEPETGRMHPIEYDGNTCMDAQAATQWSPFYRETDVKYALMNKLFAVPALRQRYIAHVRTILEESFTQTQADSLIDNYVALINTAVESDPKKIYTYNEFQAETAGLKDFIAARRGFVASNPEISAAAPSIGDVVFSADAVPFTAPLPGQVMQVQATASATAGILAVRLYFATGWVGPFERAEMLDDGLHQDGSAGDGVFGGSIPGFSGASNVRFYVEAVSNNANKTVAFAPKGAEHDVFYYQVKADATSGSSVVINEVMASNTHTTADPNGQYEDWIELYNPGNEPADLGGWSLTDDPAKLDKWQFPAGTILPANAYLIVWCDEDASQDGFHANFKLSAAGETVMLVSPEQSITQTLNYDQQVADRSFARQPNGTGSFVIKDPTFGTNNDFPVGANDLVGDEAFFTIAPNPNNGRFVCATNQVSEQQLTVSNTLGQIVWQGALRGKAEIDLQTQAAGIYLVRMGRSSKMVVVQK